MILSLRQRHRHMFTALGLLLPVALIVGVAARKAAPSVAALPAGLETSSQHFTSTEWVRDDLFGETLIQARLLRESTSAGRFAVSLVGPKDFAKPDLIVYWVAGASSNSTNVPDGARLLGAFSAGALMLPAEILSDEGALMLFSLADQEVVDVSKPLRLVDSKR